MRTAMIQIIILLTLASCKTTNPLANISTNTNHTSQSLLKGKWQITNVTFPGSDYFKVNSFQIADSKCFIGSTWNFIPNNNKGTLNLNQTECPSFNSPIVWNVNKEGNFVLKIVAPNEKSKNVKQGFILTLANQTDNSFQLIDLVNVAGQEKKIIYQFEKL